MKQIIFGAAGGCIMVFFLMILLALYGRSARQTEVRNALAESVNTALSDVKKEDIGMDMNCDSFISNFMEALLVQMNSTSDVKVSVLDADPEKGILSVEVTESYKHPNGKRGTVSEVRTVIFDQEKKKEPAVFSVSYFVDKGQLYKKYLLPENSVCPIPAVPEKEGKIFRGWKYETGGNGMAESIVAACGEDGGIRNVISSGGSPIAIEKDVALMAIFE